jgi:hypothetical protein
MDLRFPKSAKKFLKWTLADKKRAREKKKSKFKSFSLLLLVVFSQTELKVLTESEG